MVSEVDALMRSIVSCDKQSHNCVRPLSHYCHPVPPLQQPIAAQKLIVSSLRLHVMKMQKKEETVLKLQVDFHEIVSHN